MESTAKAACIHEYFVTNEEGSNLHPMTSRSGKFSAAFRITRDERGQLAEELMASIERDEDDDDDDLDWRQAHEEGEPRYSADEETPASDDRWENAPMRLTRSG